MQAWITVKMSFLKFILGARLDDDTQRPAG